MRTHNDQTIPLGPRFDDFARPVSQRQKIDETLRARIELPTTATRERFGGDHHLTSSIRDVYASSLLSPFQSARYPRLIAGTKPRRLMANARRPMRG